MGKQDYDKTLEAVETVCNIIEDVEKDLEDGKLSWIEGGELLLKYGVKAVKTIGNAKEIGAELIDTDSDEASEATQIVLDHFGNDEEAKAAVKELAAGLGGVYSGARKLIEIRKAKKSN